MIKGQSTHRTIVVVDVEGFSDRRTNANQNAVRRGLHRALRDAFHHADLPWEDFNQEDRGEGALFLAPPDVPKSAFVESLPQALVAALRVHNNVHPPEERIRLRMAVHAGEIHYDSHGVVGASINYTFRLLDSQNLKVALTQSPGVLALIASSWFYDEVIRHSRADLADYRLVSVRVKETDTTAWVTLPDHAPIRRAPRRLPVHTPHFVGRPDELEELAAGLDVNIESHPRLLILGEPGTGKTALAAHWANTVADRWPDGQLYVNLRGFDPVEQPMEPAEAITEFLDALDVSPEERPADTRDQKLLYHRLLRERRVLVLLDNARDVEHVRSLLPDSPTCLVLVTSRDRLSGLDSHDLVRSVVLDVLTPAEATSLLARRLGQNRIAAESDAAARIAEICGRLPLTLALAAARAAASPEVTLTNVADELADELTRHHTDRVRAVISWSYRGLTAPATRLLGMLAVNSGPDIGLAVAAGVAELTQDETRRLLDELTRAHLLEEYGADRYRFHDLIRAYAVAQATDETVVSP